CRGPGRNGAHPAAHRRCCAAGGRRHPRLVAGAATRPAAGRCREIGAGRARRAAPAGGSRHRAVAAGRGGEHETAAPTGTGDHPGAADGPRSRSGASMSQRLTPAPVPGYDRGEAGDKLAAAVERGQHAKTLLENELLQEAFKTLEDDYTAAWKTW